MNPKYLIVLLVLGAAVGGACLLAVKPAALGGSETTVKQSALSVHTVSPQSLAWPQALIASGQIAPWQEAIVSSETSGLAVTQLLVDVGDTVKRGQPLAILSQDSVKADFNKASAGVAEAEASLSKAQSETTRAVNLRGSGALSDQQITQYRITAQSAQAQLASAKAALEAAQINIDRTTIRASDDGVITSRTATLGTVVSAGTELFRMLRQGKLEWQAEFDATQISLIQIGQKASITLADGKKTTGTVRAISPALDKMTSRGIVYIALDPASSAISGSFASGAVELSSKDALTVPLSALVMRDGNAYLFVVSDDKRAVRNKVVIGRRQDDRVEILQGLDAQARVVEFGGAFLSDGAYVTVIAKEQAQ